MDQENVLANLGENCVLYNKDTIVYTKVKSKQKQITNKRTL